MSVVREVLSALRAGTAPPPDALARFATGIGRGEVGDAQAGAFAMGVCRTGLGPAGRAALTLAMRDSGARLDWGDGAPALDKHSTGGVGDCTSLVLAPALAACGVRVPMISGRGLGHTGGTLDKLEAIPGVSTDLDATRLRAVVDSCGCVIAGATADLAPADRKLYAVRDATSTVESVDLIVASILSKKLAAGIGGLILDVKVGSGAFMKTEAAARDLAEALVSTAREAGCTATAIITDMDQPLAPALGNAVEVRAALDVLTGRARGRLRDCTVALGARLLAAAGLAADEAQAATRLETALDDGSAAERFGRMIHAMGGPADLAERGADLLPRAPVAMSVAAETDGHVTAIDGEALGHAVVDLGGGRVREGASIDPSVGLTDVAPPGTWVARGDPLAVVHAADEASAARAVEAVRAAVTLGARPVEPAPLVRGHVG
ncbi:thymidine phosphorylase [Roseivivax marinus]|uniref:Thymidine phosphorylase n=1 Tax=Roseivivax marinus TaxID=1379903 RepID=W4HEI5_9RHOB|nr:thymidine phosphorylase [Roseivivax marinus]ETW11124.1 thymidine phosphorylase [Roseivivax marinus]